MPNIIRNYCNQIKPNVLKLYPVLHIVNETVTTALNISDTNKNVETNPISAHPIEIEHNKHCGDCFSLKSK